MTERANRANDTQPRPFLLRRQDRGLPLARQVFKSVGLERGFTELSPLVSAHLAQRRVADDLFDAAAEFGFPFDAAYFAMTAAEARHRGRT